MPKNLVIVESPAKAKTIEGYLGKDFTVKSSFGTSAICPRTIRPLISKITSSPVRNFEDKKDIVAQLKKLAKEAEIIWLATDDDREGEAISRHLKEALGSKDESVKRIVFRGLPRMPF